MEMIHTCAKATHGYKLEIWIVFILGMEQSQYVQFSLLTPQNAMDRQSHEIIGLQTSLEIAWRPVTLLTIFPSSAELQGFSDCPLFTFYTAPSLSDLSLNLAIVTYVGNGVPD